MTSNGRTNEAEQTLADAVNALGGESRIASVQTLELEGEGFLLAIGQDLTPDSRTAGFRLSPYRRRMDIAAECDLVEQVAIPNHLFWLGQEPQPKQTSGLAGTVAYNISPDGDVSPASSGDVLSRHITFYHHPIALVAAVLRGEADVDAARSTGGERLVDITMGSGLEVTLAIDAATSLPTRATSLGSDGYLGDVTVETHHDDYDDVDGLMLPTSMKTWMDDYPMLEVRVTSHTVNADIGNLAGPRSIESTPSSSDQPPPVKAEKVGDGVWHFTGQFNHSVLVEFADHLMLLNLSNEARTLAMIQTARELLPDKPLTHGVVLHHHFDHSGGLRAAVSEGLIIVTQEGNGPFFTDLVQRPRTTDPDRLSTNPRPMALEVVSEEKTFSDDSMVLHLYRIRDNLHADNFLMAYVPHAKLLIESDAWSPGNRFSPYAANLLENVEQRGLDVEIVVPTHQAVAPFSDLVSLVRGTQ